MQRNTVEVTLKYDRGFKKDEVIALDISEQELEQMIENDYQLRLARATEGEIVKRQTVQEFFDEIGNDELKSWRKHNRRLIPVKAEDEESSEMDMMDLVIDNSQEDERKRQEDYEEQCQMLRNSLSSKQAELMIAIVLDDVKLVEYAMKTGEEYNNVFRRYKRAERALKEKRLESNN